MYRNEFCVIKKEMMEASNKNRSLKWGISKVTSPTPPMERIRNEQQKGVINENYLENTKKEGTGVAKLGYMTVDPASYIFIKGLRDELKKNPTKAEKIMWGYYRNKKNRT